MTDLENTFQILGNHIEDSIQATPEQIGKSLKQFKKHIDDYMKMSDEEKHEFISSFFSDPDNLDATEAFAQRHPEAYYNKYIQRRIELIWQNLK